MLALRHLGAARTAKYFSVARSRPRAEDHRRVRRAGDDLGRAVAGVPPIRQGRPSEEERREEGAEQGRAAGDEKHEQERVHGGLRNSEQICGRANVSWLHVVS